MNDYFLADDLSGALDAAAAFHHAGQGVTIALAPSPWPEVQRGEVVGITTETRNALPADAARVIAAVIAQAHARGARLRYKKIDSTLRGPVAAETAALVAAIPNVRILFCPANPRVGRTVRSGVLLVHGIPVAETEFARDPVGPVRVSSIPVLLGDAMSPRVTIADAECEADLAAAVAQMEAVGTPWVAIGSGALAKPVAALGATRAARLGRREMGVTRQTLERPILMLCGSANPTNRHQAAEFTRESGVPCRELRADRVEQTIRNAIEDVRGQGVAALKIDGERIESGVALRAIVNTARAVIVETGVARVFATGGETAHGLCRELGISTLRFQAELEAGLSLSIGDWGGGGMLWAVKPGGFGDQHTWVRAWRALRG